ncbi:hypothetical protein [Klebsiella grimontii]|uniref:hypothetical protein n=1 Tax=Klebsiella grimontii TaxID=2058152 RepID=UPI002113AB11|nr:hypothetical protein [Klebsiella grimontii]
MTNNQLTDEQIAQLLGDACMVIGDRFATVDELSAAKAIRALAVELQERRKAAMDSEPVYQVYGDIDDTWSDVDEEEMIRCRSIGEDTRTLYTAPPMPVVDSEPVALKLPPKLSNDRKSAHELNTGVDVWNKCIDEVEKLNGKSILSVPSGLHPDTQKLVTDFCTALAEKLYKAQLKYGYSDNWSYANWEIECQTAFQEHISKGDPRDVAAYCAFMWYHGWKTEARQPAPVVYGDFEDFWSAYIHPLAQDDELKDFAWDVWNACRASMLNGGNDE